MNQETSWFRPQQYVPGVLSVPIRLVPEQKIFLEAYFDDYDSANTKLNHRAIAVKAATELLAHFNITDKDKSSLLRKVRRIHNYQFSYI